MRYVDWDLIYAAMTGNLALAKTCLQQGADARLRDNLQRTALHWAANNGQNKIVRLLLPVSNLNAVDYSDTTALDQALIHKHQYTARMIREFINAKPNAVSDEPCSDVDPAQCLEFINACITGNVDRFNDCLEHGFDPNIELPGAGSNALHLVAAKGSKEFIRIVLSVTNHQVVTNYGWTPLMNAAAARHEIGIRELLPYSVIDRVNGLGKSALDILRDADEQSLVEVVEAYLLQQKEQREFDTLLSPLTKQSSSLTGGI